MQAMNTNKTLISKALRDYVASSEYDEDVKSVQEKIEEVIRAYEIDCRDISVTVGPTVIRFEITPGAGVGKSKLKAVKDDILLAAYRVIAPVPGKGTIGIEVPRRKPQIVGLKRILESAEFDDKTMQLPIACGVDTEGKPVVVDLAKMPHLLVGGATGQGKSVMLNTIITSLLYAKEPEELRLLLIDPEKVEFSIYEKLKDSYLLRVEDSDHGVITDRDEAMRVLSALEGAMDWRFRLLKSAECTNISQYNSRADVEKMPYIVVIIDELADLMLTFGREFEALVARIAALGRAVGIHMIVATQRPTSSVITGGIKASIPGRIAFRVNQAVDSKTILGTTGANLLVGRGDMLLSQNGVIDRLQCAFIDTPEVQAICNSLSEQG